jgi:hypothetical protein
MHVTDAQFWLNLLERCRKRHILTYGSDEVSKLIAAFCRIHSLSPDAFHQLTHKKYLAHMHPKAALELLQMECKIPKDNGLEHDECNDELSSLQKRCVESFARDSGVQDVKGESGDILRNLPPLLLSEIISRLVLRRGASSFDV